MKYYLVCDHCGCEAVESEDGYFSEDDADECMACGIGGHISADDNSAEWMVDYESKDNFCEREDCEDCKELLKWFKLKN